MFSLECGGEVGFTVMLGMSAHLELNWDAFSLRFCVFKLPRLFSGYKFRDRRANLWDRNMRSLAARSVLSLVACCGEWGASWSGD